MQDHRSSALYWLQPSDHTSSEGGIIALVTTSQQSPDTIRVTYYGGPDHNFVESITVEDELIAGRWR